MTGSTYGALDSRGIELEWLLDLHQGKFGALNLIPYYSVLLGICTVLVALSGVALLLPKKRKSIGAE